MSKQKHSGIISDAIDDHIMSTQKPAVVVKLWWGNDGVRYKVEPQIRRELRPHVVHALHGIADALDKDEVRNV